MRAQDHFEKGLTIVESYAVNPSKPELQRDLWFAYERLGNLNLKTRKVDEALRLHQRALRLGLMLANDSNDPQPQIDLSDTYQDLGRVEFEKTRYMEAIEWFEKALSVLERLDDANVLPLAEQPRITSAKENIALCRKFKRAAEQSESER